MMRVVFRVGVVLAMSVGLASVSFADDPAKLRAAKKSESAVTPPAGGQANSNRFADAAASPDSTGTAGSKPVAARALLTATAPAQGKAGAGAASEDHAWTPMPATSGTLGLFTIETGETLPRKGFSFSTFVNKFSRAPGSITVLNLGWNIGVGLTDWLNFYAGFDPYRHIHVGSPINSPNAQLSLNTPSNSPLFQQFGNTIYRSMGPGLRPAYVEDFPFAAKNNGGIGEVTLGVKVGLLSERRGHPVSLSVRNDFIIPTRTKISDLQDNGGQSGAFNDAITMALSKTWSNVAILTGNAGYRITRDPRSVGQVAMNQADQFRVGAGFLLFPESRVQVMSEYTGIVFVGTATPNTSFGARDPVDGVWGVRFYAWKNVAMDVGYRYMLNLKNINDRHGFVVKVGAVYWPEKPKPVNRPPVAACSADKSMVYTGSGDTVIVRAQASDPDNDPLTYSWSATGGRVEGTGPEVRWSSAGTATGTYTVTARVDDGRGGTASCAVDVRVEPRPNRPPTMSCSADRSTVLVGERVRITAVVSDPDGDPLTFSWRTNGGQIVGSGAAVQLDTTSVPPGRYTVTGRVDDGRGGAADCSASVDVQAPPPPPQASKINECFFRASSARVDNVCKRILDDVALRLKSEPRSSLVIVGYADPKEPRPQKLAQHRGDNAGKYLADKGIEKARIAVRAASGQKGAGKQNHRSDIVFVPEGATY